MAEESHSEEVQHEHHLGLFLGATTVTGEDGITSSTVGLDYEYYLRNISPLLGIGFMGELVMADHIEYIAVVPFYFHPAGEFKIWVAPGVIEREDIGIPHEGEDAKILPYFMLRIGGDYDMQFGSYTISPTFSADFVEDEVLLVYGLTFGILF